MKTQLNLRNLVANAIRRLFGGGNSHIIRNLSILFVLLTLAIGNTWAYDPHFYLTWASTSWTNNATAWFLVSPASESYNEYCTYVWLEQDYYFGLNNGSKRYSRCDNEDQEIKAGSGSGQFGYPGDNEKTDKAFKYIGASGLVRVNVSEADADCGTPANCREYYPWVWVDEGLELGILKGEKVMFYFGSSTYKGEHNWLWLSTTSKTSHSAPEQYHRLNETKCSSYISVAYVDAGVRYYISDYNDWGGMQMEENAIAGSLYSIYKENKVDKIYRNAGAIPHFSTTTVTKAVGTVASEIAATAAKSIYGNDQTLYYYYTTDGGETFTRFNPSDISGLAVGVYTVYALGWDGHILVRSDNSVTLTITNRYSIKGTMNGEEWGTDHYIANIETIAGKDIGYAEMSLPAGTSYEFAIYDLKDKKWLKNGSDKVYYMKYGNSTNWSFADDKDHKYNCGITTAGSGTYRFNFNITDKKVSVVFPEVYRYSIKGTMNGENWGTDHYVEQTQTIDGKEIGYAEMSLPANTKYEFAIYDLEDKKWFRNNSYGVYYMSYGNSSDWGFATDKTKNCGITTAGKGMYHFSWNVTDKTMTVTYPESYQVNYGASTGGSVTSVVDDDGNSVPNGGYVRRGGSVTYTAAVANESYTFDGWCADDTYGTPISSYNPLTYSGITANSNAYAKFSSNFIIYRTGDKADDPRATGEAVESYAGGTISKAIEYRMKVRALDQWYSLCLPFTVSAVKVWDPADGPAYFDIVPYYRTGGKFYNGHYIIRTPKTATDFAIAEFDQWDDPTSATGYVPAANTPYIIQWHDDYFLNKYISFFGAAGQIIPSSMSVGAAPLSDNVVNVHGNDAMVSGSVAGAYMLEGDYGSAGAWLRLEDASAGRTVLPFECYIRANSATTTRYRILRRGAVPDDTPTGWDDVCNAEPKTDIMVYTITGFPVARYYDCSFTEAAQRLHREQGEGIYILRSANESVKLMVGGQ